MDLKENLQHFRKRQGLSQIELAEALAVSRQTISKWETGAALPSAENLAALGQLYGVAVDQLLHGGGAEPGPVPPERSPALPPPEAAPSPRRSVWGMVGAVLLFDLLMFLLQFYLFNLNMTSEALCQLLRLTGCCLMGLAFAWLDRARPVNRRTSLVLGGAALLLGLYALLMPVPLLWRLYDRVAWIGTSLDTMMTAGRPANPVFFSWAGPWLTNAPSPPTCFCSPCSSWDGSCFPEKPPPGLKPPNPSNKAGAPRPGAPFLKIPRCKLKLVAKPGLSG